MPFVKAQCPNCGGYLEVESSKEAAVCPFCNTPYIVERAINNYVTNNSISVENATINIASVNIDNLILRAKSFEKERNYEKALEYYNRVLDIDIDNAEAKEGVSRCSAVSIGTIQVYRSFIDEMKSLTSTTSKLDIIKIVREETGCGLADAKDFVEKYVYTSYSNNGSNSGSNGGANGGCYIATCVYGSYNCPQVWTLRRYRDDTLGATWYGRAFIRIYYAISPTLVKWFGKTKWFKKMWQGKLDRMVKKLNDKGVENTPYQDKQW